MSPGDSPSARLEDLGNGRFAVRSDLTFETVTSVLDESKRSFAPHERIDVDMSGVAEADSAGLALLLEWMAQARRRHADIRFHAIPDSLLAIARTCAVAELIQGPTR